MGERGWWGKIPPKCSVGRAHTGVRMGGARSREKKPAQSGWAQEAWWRRRPGRTLKVQEGDQAEGGSDLTPKEQQGERPRVRRAGSRRAQDELGVPCSSAWKVHSCATEAGVGARNGGDEAGEPGRSQTPRGLVWHVEELGFHSEGSGSHWRTFSYGMVRCDVHWRRLQRLPSGNWATT